MKDPIPESEVAYPPTLKPGNPQAQEHKTKGKLVSYVAGVPKYFEDLSAGEQKEYREAEAKELKAKEAAAKNSPVKIVPPEKDASGNKPKAKQK